MDTEKFYRVLTPFNGFSVLAGFSGGADSTAMLVLLSRIPRIKLTAVHFEHGIRIPEGSADAEWCRTFCEKRNIPFELIRIDVPKSRLPSESIEAAARRLRMAHWAEAADKNTVIALGHHAGDKAENLLLRLARGSNLSGLVSLRTCRKIGENVFVRPLIDFSKHEIKEFLVSENINDWREDYTNSDSSYRRNLIRNQVLPLIYREMDYSEQGIAHSISALELDADFIESEAIKKYQDIRGHRDTNTVFWRMLHPALGIRVLRYWLTDFLGADFVPDRNFFLRFSAELEKEKLPASGRILIPVKEKFFIKLHSGMCSLIKEAGEKPAMLEWRWHDEPLLHFGELTLSVSEGAVDSLSRDEASFDAAFIPDTLIVRAWTDGDRMVPFGSKSAVKLKKIFTDRKIPSESRVRYPVICLTCGEIIWIAGVRRSSFAPLSEEAKTVLKIKLIQ
ncbi:MAG: tRNA lysidine(34) synthetase TilS [Lentisphaerae bacterium GWF2_45_14]|nr:MAG: tRNA lysidine(34) synthetase TilS [Lentisphaerae bacterium GWF2_45_14]